MEQQNILNDKHFVCNTLKTKWDNVYIEQYKAKVDTLMHSLLLAVDTTKHTSESINNFSEQLGNILIEAALQVGISAPKRRKVQFTNRRHPKRKWFNSECELLRKQYMYTKKTAIFKEAQ